MRAHIAIFALAAVMVAVHGYPQRLDEIRFRAAELDQHLRHARDVNVDPKTGTVSGTYPVGDGKIFGTVQGDEGKFGYKTNVFDNEHGKLDASAYHGRSLGTAPTSNAGGRLDWHDDFGTASVDLSRNLHGGGTSLNAAGGGNWPIAKDWTVGAQGTYSQTFGRGSPDFGVMGTLNGRW